MTKYEKLQKQLKDANRVIEDLQRRIRYLEKEHEYYLELLGNAMRGGKGRIITKDDIDEIIARRERL